MFDAVSVVCAGVKGTRLLSNHEYEKGPVPPETIAMICPSLVLQFDSVGTKLEAICKGSTILIVSEVTHPVEV